MQDGRRASRRRPFCGLRTVLTDDIITEQKHAGLPGNVMETNRRLCRTHGLTQRAAGWHSAFPAGMPCPFFFFRQFLILPCTPHKKDVRKKGTILSPCEKGSVTGFEFFSVILSPLPCTPIKRMYGKRGQFCPRVKKGSVTGFKKILFPVGTNRGQKGIV